MPEDSLPTKLGRYEIVRELGRGAMGVVYEGRDPKIGRRVAIKTARRDVIAESGMGEEMMARFLREAQAAGQLNHPNIITIYDAGEEGGMAYIAMEFVEGEDLRDAVLHRQSMEIPEIVEIGASVCEALANAHDQGVIHRDIKPGNIIVAPGMPLKIADFGIAHVTDSTLTQDGALIGTPHYMSPEQFMGQRLDGRSDLFSVASMLYEMLSGEKPFTGEQLSTVMHKVVKTDPVPISELNYSVPEALNDVVHKALSKRPTERYPDGRAMAAALRESIKDTPDPAVLGLDPQAAADKEAQTVMLDRNPAATTVASSGPPPGVEDQSTQRPPALQPDQATKQGQLPPGVVDKASPAGTGPLAAKTPAYPRQTVLYLGLTAAILVVLVAGAALLLPDGEPAIKTGGGAPGPLAGVTSVLVAVYGTASLDTLSELDRSNFETDEAFHREAAKARREGALKPVAGAELAVWDYTGGNRGKELFRTTTDEDGEARMRIPAETGQVFFEVTYTTGGSAETATHTAAEWRTKQVLVVPLL